MTHFYYREIISHELCHITHWHLPSVHGGAFITLVTADKNEKRICTDKNVLGEALANPKELAWGKKMIQNTCCKSFPIMVILSCMSVGFSTVLKMLC